MSQSGMKILFMENRHQTRTWELAARALAAAGHQIAWMVMNHGFAPHMGDVRLLPYARKSDLRPVGDRFLEIRESDRMRYVNSTFSHYDHYDRHIRHILGDVRPDMVFGESTQFYELLCVAACRDMGIPYFVPTSSRYPAGRFVFQCYDTLQIAGGSGDTVSDDEIDAFLKRITGGEVVLDYMKVVATSKTRRSRWKQILDWTQKGLYYLAGERYSSPPPLKKLELDRRVRAALEQWNSLHPDYRETLADTTRMRLLYPMQLQPEANLEVWGRQYRNQSALIERLARAAGAATSVFVKVNPKSKYEMNTALVDVARRNPNVVAVPAHVKMSEVFPSMDAVVTATGTIAMECIFHQKPCGTLIRTRNNDLAGCRFLETPEDVRGLLDQLAAGTFPMQTREEIAAFVRKLYAESYRGIVQDPYTLPETASPENAAHLADSFQRFVSTMRSARADELSVPMAESR